jgi:hypothetical protein
LIAILRTSEQPGCRFISAKAHACKSWIESRVFTILFVAFTSKPLLSYALSGRFHDLGEAGSTTFRSAEEELRSVSWFQDVRSETLSVNLTQRVDGRASVFVADFTVVVAVAIVQAGFAHAALHCAYSQRASSCLDQMAILHRNQGSRRAYRTNL